MHFHLQNVYNWESSAKISRSDIDIAIIAEHNIYNVLLSKYKKVFYFN